MISRRDCLRHLGVGAGLLGAPFLNFGRMKLFGQTEYSTRAVDLVRESTVIDMLGLVTLNWPKLERWQKDPAAFGQSDFDKLTGSGITVFHPAVDVNTPDPHDTVTRWMADWNRFLDCHPDKFVRVSGSADLACAKQDGKIGIILGLQNSDHFRSVEDVTAFHQMGQRVSQLTYNDRNAIGNGCTERNDDGISEFGHAVVKRMNELGMAIDVSHSGDRTTMDAIELSTKPVLITHSNCRALVPTHPRCKSDTAIKKLAATGGVMGVTGIRPFVRASDPTTIEDVLNHFDYLAKLVGVDHIGVGSDTDLDGRDHNLPPHSRYRMDIEGLNHPKRMFDLTEGLIRRKFSDADVRQILGGNFQRVLKQIWAA